MNKKLIEAIEIIENAGGFVMMQEIDKDTSEEELLQLQEEEKERFNEHQKRKLDCLKEFDELLKSKQFSYSKVGDMVHSHGLDMDDLEELIHKFY